MQFRAEVLFQIESSAELTWAIKKTYFKGFHEFTLINVLCSFDTTFINTLFNLSSLKNTFCSEQTNAWFKIKGDYFGLLTGKLEKIMVLNIDFIKVITFRKYNIWEFDQNIQNFVPEK